MPSSDGSAPNHLLGALGFPPLEGEAAHRGDPRSGNGDPRLRPADRLAKSVYQVRHRCGADYRPYEADGAGDLRGLSEMTPVLRL